jgi:uncharacterized protein YgbK (DUF1537 family)
VNTHSIRLVADDLTGALDAGVHFSTLGASTVRWGAPAADGLALSIDARDGDEAEARRCLRPALAWLGSSASPFLKIDSRFRGHVAALAADCWAALKPRRVMLCPAAPRLGRAVRGGRVWSRDADGVWTAEPVAPVEALTALGLPVRRARAGDAAPDGVILWDVETAAEADAVAAAGLAADGRTLWVGAAGLAEALAAALGATAPARAVPTGPILGVVGTRHPLTERQRARLRARAPDREAQVTPDGAGAAAVSAALAQGRSIVAVVAPVENELPGLAAAAVTAALGTLLPACPRPAGLLVTGGATLSAVAAVLGAEALELQGVFEPGAPVARLLGGRWDSAPVVSKSGGFGRLDLLADLFGGAHDGRDFR